MLVLLRKKQLEKLENWCFFTIFWYFIDSQLKKVMKDDSAITAPTNCSVSPCLAQQHKTYIWRLYSFPDCIKVEPIVWIWWFHFHREKRAGETKYKRVSKREEKKKQRFLWSKSCRRNFLQSAQQWFSAKDIRGDANENLYSKINKVSACLHLPGASDVSESMLGIVGNKMTFHQGSSTWHNLLWECCELSTKTLKTTNFYPNVTCTQTTVYVCMCIYMCVIASAASKQRHIWVPPLPPPPPRRTTEKPPGSAAEPHYCWGKHTHTDMCILRYYYNINDHIKDIYRHS